MILKLHCVLICNENISALKIFLRYAVKHCFLGNLLILTNTHECGNVLFLLKTLQYIVDIVRRYNQFPS